MRSIGPRYGTFSGALLVSTWSRQSVRARVSRAHGSERCQYGATSSHPLYPRSDGASHAVAPPPQLPNETSREAPASRLGVPRLTMIEVSVM